MSIIKWEAGRLDSMPLGKKKKKKSINKIFFNLKTVKIAQEMAPFLYI